MKSDVGKPQTFQWLKEKPANPATLTIDFNHDMLAMQAAVTV
jgi:hypothetical protein